MNRNIGLVYGGANIGLMGILANTMLEHGGEVIGVMPSSLFPEEIAHNNLSGFYQVNSILDRKNKMFELADLFITFPGGLGTLDELFEIWNASKMGLHKKPMGILNINGYFDLLLQFIQQTINNNFMKQAHLDLMVIGDDVSELLELMTVEKLNVRY